MLNEEKLLNDMSNKDTVFSGLCLMNTKEFDKNHILLSLNRYWKIKVNADMQEYFETDETIAFSIDEMNCFIKFIDSKIPEEEIGLKASFNYNFEDAKQICMQHNCYIAVGVVGGENKVKAASLFTKIASAVLQQPNAIAIYTTYNVIQADDFIDEAAYMIRDYLPIEDWIYIGFTKDEYGKMNAYTIGMKNFSKDEMEILDFDEPVEVVRNRLLNVAYFLLDNDQELSDGETMTLKEARGEEIISLEFEIKYDKAVNGKGKTIKIFPKSECGCGHEHLN